MSILGSGNTDKNDIEKCGSIDNCSKEENLETSFNSLSVCPVSIDVEDKKEAKNENQSNDNKTENPIVNSDSNVDGQIEASNDSNPIQIEPVSTDELENKATPDKIQTNKNFKKVGAE